ncbi:permease [Candidatus Shapirobacteria bacterium CG09_land_8_20_14_0_10_39_12]|uniref:Permease n=1 Tax=Candidatus Shapirobacteria bacterium CG09_land_8_20_14_0_10_39_12 TaxID=1974885 RepID=A0A2H0WNW3_9BACT|nr:MAG: permease [Candidatus Shapirobacteria bacterium CG09_land_8_20_14_0_10_39_12]
MINNAFIFIIVSIILSLISFFLDRNKTILGFKKGLKMFKSIAIPFLNILILVSLALYFIPQSLIIKYLGAGSGIWGLAIASFVGSVTLIPGFISYPIAAALVKQGASYATVATFMTTLMMVGVVTFPLEAKYFGNKVAAIRNILNFITAIIIGLLVGLVLWR